MSHFFRELVTGMAREFGRSIASAAIFVVGCVAIVTGGILVLALWIGYLVSRQPAPTEQQAVVPTRHHPPAVQVVAAPEVEDDAVPAVDPEHPAEPPDGHKPAAEKPPAEKPDREKAADARLVFARAILRDPARKTAAIRRLEAIVKDFPETRAATEAGELLARNR